MKTLLLTGGTGFFGKSILDAFRRGLLAPFGVSRIVAVARHATQLRSECPELCGPGVELRDADVLRIASTEEADLVIHAAASSDARRYCADPGGEERIIVDGTRRICAAIDASGRRPSLLYVSSGAVYGRQPADVEGLREDAPLADDADPLKSAYTTAKRTAEAIVRDWAAGSMAAVRIARCFAFVGPWLPREQHFAIGNFIANALRGEAIEVRARHPVVRSYLHADDLAAWLLTIATAPGDGCEVFNVGSDEAVTIRDLALLVGRLGGVSTSLPEVSAADGMGAPQVDRYVPDIGKARRELGLAVTIPLPDAVERTLWTLRSMPRCEGQPRAGRSAGISA